MLFFSLWISVSSLWIFYVAKQEKTKKRSSLVLIITGFYLDFNLVMIFFLFLTCQNKRKQALLGSNLPGILLTVDENVTQRVGFFPTF